MRIHQVTRVLDVKAELGECPLWCVDDQCLYWLDIMGRTINRFDPQSGQNSVWSLPADVAPSPAHVASIGGIQNFASNTAGILTSYVFGFLKAKTGSFVAPLCGEPSVISRRTTSSGDKAASARVALITGTGTTLVSPSEVSR